MCLAIPLPYRSFASTLSALNARRRSRSRRTPSEASELRFRYLLLPELIKGCKFRVGRNTDYVAEHGAQRNFEPWRDTADEKQDIDKLDLLEQEENDPMADLESKAVDSKREMDILDALQELRSRNARIERAGKQDLNADRILDRVSSNAESVSRELETKLTEAELRRRKEEAEDEEEVRRVFGRAFVEGVPDIELDETGSSSTTDEDSSSEPGTPRDGSEVSSASEGSSAPIAGGSGLRTGASAGAGPIEASIKRKLDAVEPSPASLLSDASKSFVQKSVGSGGMPPPKKKKINAALAAKLGIKVTAKK